MAQHFDGNKSYKKIKHLGEGSFGKVYLVQGADDDLLYVIKECNINKMDEKHIHNTLTEVKVLKTMNHPNIICFKEVYKTKKGKLCIVMEYADGGDLSMAINSQNGKHFSEDQILDWFTQICLALKYVHESKILHRDLKCQNIFLTEAGAIKLGDFGIACILSNTLENAKTIAGTPFNLSPEIIDGKEYSYKSDIWSLGIVLYELCSLHPPFMANGFTLLAVKIMKGQYTPIPKHYSRGLHTLISMLLKTNPNDRPTVSEILNLPFIKQRIMEPWGITKNMYLSPHPRDIDKAHSYTVSTCDQSFSQKNSELNTSNKFITVQNQNGYGSPKAVRSELSKRQSHPYHDVPSNSNLLPVLGQVNNMHSHSQHNDLSSLNHTKQSSFLGIEDEMSNNSNFHARYRNKSPIEDKDDIDWESIQRMQKTTKKAVPTSHKAAGIVVEDGKHHKFKTPPRNQHVLEPYSGDHRDKANIFKKLVEHDMGSISTEVSPGRNSSVGNSKKLPPRHEKPVHKNLYPTHEDQEIKRNLSGSPDKGKKLKPKQEQPSQEQDEFKRMKEDHRHQALKSEFEHINDQEKYRVKYKIEEAEEIKKEVLKEARKKKDGLKIYKANSVDTEHPIDYPLSPKKHPSLDTETLFNHNISQEDIDEKKGKPEAARMGTEPEELQYERIKPKCIYKVHVNADRANKKEFRSVNKIDRNHHGNMDQKNLPELESPIRGKFGPERQTIHNHYDASRREDSINGFKDGLDFSIREMNGSYYGKQGGTNYIHRQKPSTDQINKSKIITKGVLAAVSKVMSQFGPNDTAHDKFGIAKDLASIKESSEINYQRERLRQLGTRRNKISDFNHQND